MTGAITTNSTFDGRDVSTDGTKLDGIAASANNYVHPNHSGDVTSSADGATTIADDAVTAAKLANSINTDIATGVTANTTANAALPKSGGAMTGAITTNSTFDGVDIATRDAVLTSTTTTANAALPKAGGAMTGAITTNSTFDGVDIATRDAVLTSTTTTANAALPKAGGTLTGTVTVSANAVGTVTTDNDGSFSMSATNNFKCTPTGNFTLTFTNIVAQSGNILLVNSGGHTVAAHANTKVDANFLATVSTAGTYLLAYFSDGTNVYMTNSAIYT